MPHGARQSGSALGGTDTGFESRRTFAGDSAIRSFQRWPPRDLPDLRPRQGPLAGLEAALAAAEGRDVFLLACDLPAVDRALVRRILDRPDSFGHDAAEARVAVDEEGLQPLCALYSSTCAPLVRNSLDRGERAARDLLAVLRVTAVEAGGQLVNLNTPDDWARWTAGSAGEHPAS
ncbi:MAG: NTP transferase domain-containing protein [Thermoanaerobaculia bacterium]